MVYFAILYWKVFVCDLFIKHLRCPRCFFSLGRWLLSFRQFLSKIRLLRPISCSTSLICSCERWLILLRGNILFSMRNMRSRRRKMKIANVRAIKRLLIGKVKFFSFAGCSSTSIFLNFSSARYSSTHHRQVVLQLFISKVYFIFSSAKGSF